MVKATRKTFTTLYTQVVYVYGKSLLPATARRNVDKLQPKQEEKKAEHTQEIILLSQYIFKALR